jgi:hypothetical protein
MSNYQPISTKRRRELLARVEAAKKRVEVALARLTPEERAEINSIKVGTLIN